MSSEFRAHGSGYSHATAATPRAAALAFFEKYPTKRKCDVIEGETDGHFFTVTFGRASSRGWRDITKKTAADLPA